MGRKEKDSSKDSKFSSKNFKRKSKTPLEKLSQTDEKDLNAVVTEGLNNELLNI